MCANDSNIFASYQLDNFFLFVFVWPQRMLLSVQTGWPGHLGKLYKLTERQQSGKEHQKRDKGSHFCLPNCSYSHIHKYIHSYRH